MKYSFLFFLLFSIGLAQAQKDDPVSVMATIICECIDNATEKDWKANPETILSECEQAGVLGGLLSAIPTSDSNTTSTTTDDSGVTEINKKEKDEAYKQLESNCPRYQEYVKTKVKDFTDLKLGIS